MTQEKTQDDFETALPQEPKQQDREDNVVISFLRDLIRPKTDVSALRETLEEFVEQGPQPDEELSFSAHEKKLISNILKVRDMTAADLMTPRADIVAISQSSSQADLFALLAEKQYSHLPVYKETLDDVVGAIHIKDILAAVARGHEISIPDLTREVPIISPSMYLLDLLLQMRLTRKHMALVVDEFGGIDGLVTINNVIEVIVGEIYDEHDPEDEAELVEKPDGTFIADARFTLDDFELKFGKILSDHERAESDTLGGLVIYMTGRVPVRGEVVSHPSGFVFEILEADPRRVKRIRLGYVPVNDAPAKELRLPNALVCFGLGALSALAMAPFNVWPVLFFTLSFFYVLIHTSTSWKRAALYGLAFGLGYFGFGLYWIGNALLVEGNPYRWAWPLAVCGLLLMLSPFTAVACGLIKKYNKLDTLAGFVSFAFIFTLFEWLRGHLFTGFPWNLFGYTWADTLPIAQLASLHDIYLLTLLTIFWASAGGYLFVSPLKKIQKLVITLCIVSSFCGAYGYGFMRLQNAQESLFDGIDVVLIQPNIAQNEKWDPEAVVQNLLTMAKSSANMDPDTTAKATYIIWPETAISSGMISVAWVRSAIVDMLGTYPHPAYLITGAQRYVPEGDQYYNSILVFDKNAEVIQSYDKSHLVPFGEYMPLSSIIDIAPIVGFKGFETGPGPSTLKMPEGPAFSPLICYEVIFPGKAINPQDKPDFIVNVTNDAWYGFSPGPYQHLIQAQFRAIETGIPVLRVANTGFTAIIDPKGRILSKTGLFETVRVQEPLPR